MIEFSEGIEVVLAMAVHQSLQIQKLPESGFEFLDAIKVLM